MKKIKTFAVLSILITSLFTACKDPVFYSIMNDVPPEKATISGNINAISRYTSADEEYIVTYASQGIVYKKTTGEDSHGNWKTYNNLPFSLHHYDYYGAGHEGEQIIKVAADSKYLYIVTISYRNDTDVGTNAPDYFTIWAREADLTETEGTWSKVSTDKLGFYKDSSGLYHTQFNVFCTNDVSKANRSAYFRGSDDKVYKLNGETASECSATITGDGSKIDSVVYYNGTVLFFSSTASVATDKAVYWAEGNTIKYKVGNGSIETAFNAGTEVLSLAATKDALLIGRGNVNSGGSASFGGLVKTSIAEDGTPGSELTEFQTNATSQLSSAYYILSLLCADPSKTELEATIYASMAFKGSGSSTSVSYDGIGLWSYYPSRGNWNRE